MLITWLSLSNRVSSQKNHYKNIFTNPGLKYILKLFLMRSTEIENKRIAHT